ncbi:hypothetical protein V6N12_019445 [Hibiscus sabdariffa]|uniref:Uncharacterized protein n=1 Tax=Hibiscus sabdariffa TaxID=183260 RepID=A0ABR2BM85_9ROSI
MQNIRGISDKSESESDNKDVAVTGSERSLQEGSNPVNSDILDSSLQSSEFPDITDSTLPCLEQPLHAGSVDPARSARPMRNRALPQKFKDYQVSLPKTRTSPHSIAQH